VAIKAPVVANPTEPVPLNSKALDARLEVPAMEPVMDIGPETERLPFIVREPVTSGKY
jgi:hypothetical protein